MVRMIRPTPLIGEVDRILSGQLQRFTSRTLCDPAALLAELEAVRGQGWSHDPGEFDLLIRANAADASENYAQAIRAAAQSAALEIGAAL